MRVVIVGGGISGLSLAYYLKKRHPHWTLTVLEQSDRWGGKINTSLIDQHVHEHGPDALMTRHAEVMELIEQLGLTEDIIERIDYPIQSMILSKQQFFAIPEGLSGLVPLRLEALENCPLICSEGLALFKQKLNLEPWHIEDELSLEDFFIEQFGKPVYDVLVAPLLLGIYGTEGHRLSAQAIFPHLVQIAQKHGSMVKYLSGQSLQKSPKMISFKHGLSTIIDALVSQLHSMNVDMKLNSAVNQIKRIEDKYQVICDDMTYTADHLVLTSGFKSASSLLKPSMPALATALSDFNYSSSHVVSMMYAGDTNLNHFHHGGYLVQNALPQQVMAVSFSTQKWSREVKDNRQLLRVFIRGHVNQAYAEQLAINHIQQFFKTPRPLWIKHHPYPNSIPLYELGHLHKEATLSDHLSAYSNLTIIGPERGGVGLADCLHKARSRAYMIG